MITITYTDGSIRIIHPDKSFYQSSTGLVDGREKALTPADKVNQMAADSGKAYKATLFMNGEIRHKIIFTKHIPPVVPDDERSRDEILTEKFKHRETVKQFKRETRNQETTFMQKWCF